MIEPNKLSPFQKFCVTIGMIPSSYKTSLTYEEQLLWLCNYLEETIIPALNNNAEALHEVQELYMQLKNYVDNYFTNLDVQQEINNKLDQMAQDGTLTEIIAQYLQLNGILAYNTTLNLKSASNIVNGSICRTLGDISYNDGKGNFYKIRNITSSDIVDENKILSLEISNTLIAEKIENYYLNEIEKSINLYKNKKFLFVGDSYAVGYQPGTENIKGYYNIVKDTLNLNADIVCENGYGFSGNQHNKKWKDLIENSNLQNKESYTDIFICGGMNDTANEDIIVPAINECINYLKQNFINAKIHIGMISHYSYTNNEELERIINIYNIYKLNAIKNNCSYINNSEHLLHDVSWFHSDNMHPNIEGEKALANGIMEYINCNNLNVFYKYKKANITPNDNIDLSSFSMYTFMENNTCRVLFNGNIKFNTGVEISNVKTINLGKISSGYIMGSPLSQGISATFETYIYDSSISNYRNVRMNLRNNQDNDLILTPFTILQNGGRVTIGNVTEIGIAEGNATDTIPSLYC